MSYMKKIFLILPLLFMAQVVFAVPGPIVAEFTPIGKTNNTTPIYIFNATNLVLGTPDWGGSCDGHFSETVNSVGAGNNNFVANVAFAEGTYSDCTLVVNSGVSSNTLNISSFTIDTTAPTVGEIDITPYTPGTPNFTITNVSTISAQVSDVGAGIDPASCRYSINNGASSAIYVSDAYDAGLGRCIFTDIDTSHATGITISVDDLAGNFFNTSSSWVQNFIIDTDADGVVEADDNCPTDANADQADVDGNGVGNVCDVIVEVCGNSIDDDGDGATDEECDGDGSLPGEDDVFWDVMGEIVRPDDSTCVNETNAIFAANGIPTGGNRALVTCDAIAQMMLMEDAMNDDGVDTNLFDYTDWHHITGLYFETPYGRIEFTHEIDFMSYDFMMFLQTIRDRINMETGEISLDADIVNGLRNAGAVITMYNVPDFANLEIYVNGEPDLGGIVSGLVYDRINHTITFNAAHFTRFTARERDSVSDGDDAERAKIYGVTVQRILTFGGKERIMLTIKGDDFDKDADVKLGSRKAYKVKYKSKKKIIAYFRPNDLKNVADPAYVKVINEDADSKKFKKKIYWRDLPLIKEADLMK